MVGMDGKNLKKLIFQDRNSSIDLFNSTADITDPVFQSICSFLNKEGGTIALGVNNYGEIVGINDQFLTHMLNKLTEVLKGSFSPIAQIKAEIVEVDNKKVLCLNIPKSQHVHRFRGKIYDRLGDEVSDVTYTYNLIENIYLRKREESSENIVLPFMRMSELDDASFVTMRKYITAANPNHPWLDLTNEEFLHTAGFWRKDPMSNKEGFVLAAVLLFGKEVTIQNYCPVVHRTDAIYRNISYENFLKPSSKYPESKYDDRDMIFSNLIESYKRLKLFIERHLPPKKVTLNAMPIDVRTKVFGELISNLLVHREYTHKYPCRLLIFSNKVITENGTRPMQNGTTLDTLGTSVKNPLITKVFQEMKWIEEPGSGRLNILKYAAYYDKTYVAEIQNDEKFVWSVSYGNEGLNAGEVPIPKRVVVEKKEPEAKPIPQQRMYNGWPVYDSKLFDVCPGIDISYIEKAESVLEVCVKPRPIQEMMQMVKQSNRTRFRQNILRPLIDEGLLAMRIPTKPSSPLQKYFTTEKGKALL